MPRTTPTARPRKPRKKTTSPRESSKKKTTDSRKKTNRPRKAATKKGASGTTGARPMASPDDRRYRDTHEWHKLEDGLVVIGLSKFAVDELTDITYLDVIKTEGPIHAGEAFGEIESVKTTSDLYCGIDGTVVAVNEEAIDNPALINEDPFGQAWLIKVRPTDPAQLDALMSSDVYDAQTAA